jgi:hypothetical protein
MGSISSLTSLSNTYLQSLLGSTQQGSLSGASSGTSSVATQSENGQLSPFAQLMSTLQHLQQSNPTEYKQVTGQIATNLQTAAKAATADGNSTAANQLDSLAADFSNASQSGQPLNVQDIAQAAGGGHHHHHHGHAASSDTASSDTDASSTQLNQALSAFQANSTPNAATDPMAIIMNTLSSAGITPNS